jgi:rhamnogalacturonyl hydrolase YesR
MKTDAMNAVRGRAPACVFALGLVLMPPWSFAEGPYRNRDNPHPGDWGDGDYPIRYQLPTTEEVAGVLERIHGYLEKATPTRVVDRVSGAEIGDFSVPVENAVADRGRAGAFGQLDYTMGVVHSGMLLASEVTGDPRYTAFTERHLRFLAERAPYFRAQAKKLGLRRNSFRHLLAPESLDASGSMCAALIKARHAGVGPDLQGAVETWIDYISNEQSRLPDGTLARHRPQRASLWTDDYYMSIPALAQMGAATGDKRYFDDAVKNALQMAARLFDPRVGLFMHGNNVDQPLNPEFYWGRANGWAMMAIVELLDVLPSDHPRRDEVLALLRAHIKGVAVQQSGEGLWHQLLDRTDSYIETSASAMFVFSIAWAINRGWISPISYGSLAQAGWIGVTERVTAEGQVMGTCVGTTFASDAVYYYHRPTSPLGTMGYGPVILAGAEIIRLLQNDAFEIQHTNRTYHYVPR